MARIRSIHPSFFTNEACVSCSSLARLLYIGLWTDADDQGIFEWRPLQLKMRLLPGDMADAADLLLELLNAGLIASFEHDGAKFGAIKEFRKYQRPKKPMPVHDLPDEWRDFVSLTDEDEDPVAALRRRLCEEQDGKCFYCASAITHYSKRFNSLEIDHRVPRAKGGSDDESNLAAACRACNRGKCDRSEREWRAELAARVGSPFANRSVAPPKVVVANAREELAPQMEDVGEREGEDGKKERGGARGSRLPPDWVPSEIDRAYAVKEGFTPASTERVAEKFRNFWSAKSGRDAVKVDWPATWRNWVLTEAERRGIAPNAVTAADKALLSNIQ